MAEDIKSEDTNTTKDQDAKSTGGASNIVGASSSTGEKQDPDLMSPADIDSEILKADPLFLAEFETYHKINSESADVNIESYNPEQELNAYMKDLKQSRGFKKWLFRVLPFVPKLIKYLALVQLKLKSLLIHVATVLLPLFLVFLKNQLLWFFGVLKKVLQSFQAKTGVQKIGILFFIVFAAGASATIWYIWVKKPLDHQSGLFVNSLEELASATYKYDPKTEVEPFYGNYRVSQNILTIPRMVVNIRPSVNSGPNPMAAVELYIEGGSPEVVVEIKDREAEMKDAMQRVMEEMSFDELISPEGKPALSEKIRKELNRIVTKGKVRRVFMKSAIFKP